MTRISTHRTATNIDAKPMLGAALGSEAVYCVRLQRRARRQPLAIWSMEPLPTDPSAADVAEALRRARRRLPGSATEVAIGAPATSIMRRDLRVETDADPARNETRLGAEAAKLFPYPAEQMALDYQRVGERLNLRICHHATLQYARQLAENAGLRLRRLEPADEARARGIDALREGRHLRAAPGGDVNCQPQPEALAEAYALASGGGFNLLPWRGWRLRAANRRFAQVALLTLLLAQAPALVMAKHWRAQQAQWHDAHRRIESRMMRHRRQLQALNVAHERQLARHREAARQRGWRRRQLQVTQALLELRELSKFLRWRRLRLQGRQLQLDGTAAHIEAVNHLMTKLRRGGLIHGAQLLSIQVREDGGGHDFSLRGHLPPEEIFK